MELRALIRKYQAQASVSKHDVASGEHANFPPSVSWFETPIDDEDGEPGSGSESEDWQKATCRLSTYEFCDVITRKILFFVSARQSLFNPHTWSIHANIGALLLPNYPKYKLRYSHVKYKS